jgi:dolichol-phosphate mannosyltransferase
MMSDALPLPPSRQASPSLAEVHVVLPAYNEEDSLPALLGRLEAFRGDRSGTRPLRVWVIDDGSTDRTAELATADHGELPVTLVRHPVNRGLGQAVRTGLASVAQATGPDDIVVIMDADDTHDVALIDRLAAAIDHGADIAIASRFVAGGDDRTAPPLRRLLSRAAAWIFRTALPVDGVEDFTSGYRAYRVALLRRAVDHYGERLVEEQGFAVMVELLLKLRYCAPVIVEVPMVLHYDRKGSDSKLKLGRTLVQYLKLLVRDRLAPAPFREL